MSGKKKKKLAWWEKKAVDVDEVDLAASLVAVERLVGIGWQHRQLVRGEDWGGLRSAVVGDGA